MSFKARFQPHRGFLFFLVLSVTRPSPSLGQVLVGTLNHATCNVYSPKAFEALIHEKDLGDSKGILRTLKKVSSQPDNALRLQISLSLRDK